MSVFESYLARQTSCPQWAGSCFGTTCRFSVDPNNIQQRFSVGAQAEALLEGRRESRVVSICMLAAPSTRFPASASCTPSFYALAKSCCSISGYVSGSRSHSHHHSRPWSNQRNHLGEDNQKMVEKSSRQHLGNPDYLIDQLRR